MNSVLKDFYRGNLTPAERQTVKGAEMARVMEELSKSEDVLRESLAPDLLPALKRLTDAQVRISGITAETYYIDGFKTGARLMLDILSNAHENLKPI